MSVKVTSRKSNEQILFVEAGDDFIDFVCSLLTFPLGGVLHMLQGFSSLSGIDNLYKSFSDLSPDIYLMSERLKDKLCKPFIAPKFELKNQILPIGAAFLRVNYCHNDLTKEMVYSDYNSLYNSFSDLSPDIYLMSEGLKDKLCKPFIAPKFELKNQILPIGAAFLRVNYCHNDLTKEMMYSDYNRIYEEKYAPFKLVDPKSSIAKSSYAKGPSMYMVTDDLCVSPMSSISTMSFLEKSKVPLYDLEERVIKIGVKEVCTCSSCNCFLFANTTLTFGYML